MATVAITPLTIVKDVASVTKPIASATAIVAADTNTFAYLTEGDLLIQINNTYAGAKNFTFGVGFGIAAGKGTLVVAVAQNAVQFVVLSSDRFRNSSGLVSLTYESGTTGFVQAFYLPK